MFVSAPQVINSLPRFVNPIWQLFCGGTLRRCCTCLEFGVFRHLYIGLEMNRCIEIVHAFPKDVESGEQFGSSDCDFITVNIFYLQLALGIDLLGDKVFQTP